MIYKASGVPVKGTPQTVEKGRLLTAFFAYYVPVSNIYGVI